MIVITLCFTIRPILQKLDAVTLWQINRIYKEQGYISSLVKEIKYFYIEQPEGYSVGKPVELAQDIEDGEKQHFSVLHVACPYCGTTMSGEVHKTAEAFSYTAEIQDGREPYFGLELWFLTSFQGKPVWALNREHLAYLIDYLSADLRE